MCVYIYTYIIVKQQVHNIIHGTPFMRTYKKPYTHSHATIHTLTVSEEKRAAPFHVVSANCMYVCVCVCIFYVCHSMLSMQTVCMYVCM